ncbi:MAG: hypothetical protein JJV99_09430 [Colwellia sp.]|nr:hypothetical protein [Colwellia sp.]
MEIIVVLIAVLALSALAWLIWQLIKAKRFNRFKQKIEDELKDKVIVSIINELEENRSNLYPNNDSHQEATVFYWTQYKSRILHAALQREIITEQWLRSSGNLRNAQHLFYVEKKFIL